MSAMKTLVESIIEAEEQNDDKLPNSEFGKENFALSNAVLRAKGWLALAESTKFQDSRIDYIKRARKEVEEMQRIIDSYLIF